MRIGRARSAIAGLAGACAALCALPAAVAGAETALVPAARDNTLIESPTPGRESSDIYPKIIQEAYQAYECTLDVDRINENVASLYQPFHPAVLKILRDIFAVAESMGKPVSICGELGGDPMATFLLLGLGKFHELSMEPHSIPKVKKILRKVTLKEARELADHALSLSTSEEINRFINNEMRNRFPSDFDRDLAFGEKKE